ncbi:MAG: hypothetical protein ACW981_13755 [Candidatus Hodarchaeales archaeon]|jgi:DNA-binding transcriptional ArsR family regulator
MSGQKQESKDEMVKTKIKSNNSDLLEEKSINERIKELHETWLRRFNKSLVDQPITATIYYCIHKYQGDEGLTAKRIAEILIMKPTAIYHHIIKLEEENLIISIEDPKNPSRRRYFDNRPDVLYELREKNSRLCNNTLEKSFVKSLIKNSEDLDAFKQKYKEYIRNKFKAGGKNHFKEVNDLRRSVSVISASAMEADTHLKEIKSQDQFDQVIQEDPFVVTLFADHDRYHLLMKKIKEEIIKFISEEPECTEKYSADHESKLDKLGKKYPFTISIMGLPPLIAFREDHELE